MSVKIIVPATSANIGPLQFRGSSNQRIIDVQRSLKEGQVVIWDKLTK